MNDYRGPRPYDFMKGYPRQNVTRYMNIGYLSPYYPGKVGWGDYGPSQGGEVYYNPYNRTYPYPMDLNSGYCCGYGKSIQRRFPDILD